jgi:hypothetical protein
MVDRMVSTDDTYHLPSEVVATFAAVPTAGTIAGAGTAGRAALVAETKQAVRAAAGLPAAVIEITYDGSNRVSTVTEDGDTTTFTYNTDNTIATDTRGGIVRTYTYSGGKLTRVSV